MTKAEIRAEIQRRLAEVTPGVVWTVAEIDTAIAEGYAEIGDATECVLSAQAGTIEIDPNNSRAVHAKFPSQVNRTFAGCLPTADRRHYCSGNACQAVSVTNGPPELLSTLAHHVGGVVLRAAQEQVIRIDTTRHIAPMQNVNACRNGSTIQLPRRTVSEDHASRVCDTDLTVALRIAVPGPQPTAGQGFGRDEMWEAGRERHGSGRHDEDSI